MAIGIGRMCILAAISILMLISLGCCSRQGDQVYMWADTLGNELSDLGRSITQYSEIQQRYRVLGAKNDTKKPQRILTQIVNNISRMMDRKMDAINCILQVAEFEALNYSFDVNFTDFRYYNSKYSPLILSGNDDDENATLQYVKDIPESIEANLDMYLPLELNNDTHFYNVPVNTEHSSVHVPTNVYDKHREPAFTIQWSEQLDKVFTQNYKSDPALSWQYFGSSTGLMRHYPAMRWKQEEVDKFDCRIRTWFIEATTCTKDVVILLDNSGSMQGMRKHIASFTVYSILDTFSNNDFVNVLNYSTHINYTVPCFKDKLVQATKENIQTFKYAVRALDPDKKSDVEVAMIHAFDLLKRTREEKGCNETGDSDCNQAIMLVTDGIKGNLSHVFEKYNWFNNATNIPVRIFTYLIGAEVTKVNEIMWAACRNRGYYTHVQSLEQVAEDVFKYVPVIARPLVLQRESHPSSWTHSYADLTYDDENDNVLNEPYRLLTSVAAPAFDLRANENNESVVADILGVAATDVPLDDIIKLTLPYKLGVMAYSFIVTNNGYVLFHPDLRPVFNKTILKENYNSIDLVEVEQLDDDEQARVIGRQLLDLRLALVNAEEGAMHDVPLKYHFDDNRRVTRQLYDYYYAPIKNTPFTFALVVPDQYGNISIEVGDMIEETLKKGENISQYFKGNNWKIHPKWVYCKYHYLEGHEFSSPEMELKHFIAKIDNRTFHWHEQYEEDDDDSGEHDEFDQVICGRQTLGDEAYYCNRELMQRLVFDAINTYPAYENAWTFRVPRDRIAFERYNATLRFVSTLSGFTRWEYIDDRADKGESGERRPEFGDLAPRAIDENWYKSAVVQSFFDNNSFVYSVPFETGAADNVKVTASQAILPEYIKSPGSVVGFQFSHDKMWSRFREITSEVANCMECVPCGELLDCFMVDSSGYVILSHDRNHTGRFFGAIEGAVMETMLAIRMFEKVTVYDYQALCMDELEPGMSAAGNHIFGPLDFVTNLVMSILANIANLVWNSVLVRTQEFETTVPPYFDEGMFIDEAVVTEDLDVNEEDEKEAVEKEEPKPIYFPCDQQKDLYTLNQTMLMNDTILSACGREFIVRQVPHTNLLFIAINASIDGSDCIVTLVSEPENIVYENITQHPCQKLGLNDLPRKRLVGCFNEHPLEQNITICGRSSLPIFNIHLVVTLFLLSLFMNRLRLL